MSYCFCLGDLYLNFLFFQLLDGRTVGWIGNDVIARLIALELVCGCSWRLIENPARQIPVTCACKPVFCSIDQGVLEI